MKARQSTGKNPRLATVATAYHEAGHAVADHLFHHRIKRVTIIPNKKENYQGCVQAKQASVKGIDCEVSPRLERAARGRIISALAGICAQRLFNPRTCRSYHPRQDYQQAISLAEHLLTGPKEMEPFLDWMMARTENLLRNNWKAVELLAEELIRRLELSGKEAHEIIRSAPFEPKWDEGEEQTIPPG
jgi:ATP-dependent Zn protease